MKKYKECDPLQTIDKIRKILTTVGVLLRDTHTNNDKFFSCRVNIGNDGLNILNLGTNGKGNTFEYCMASAYAEFMERLQNDFLITKRRYGYKDFIDSLPSDSLFASRIKEENLVLDYLCDKQEEVWSIEKAVDSFKEELKTIFKLEESDDIIEFLKKILRRDDVVMIPFFNLQTQTTQFLPIEIIWLAMGSNGMCAGNTPKEAILQGLCEIFERYVATEIYCKEITPPTIPYDDFKGTSVYEKLIELIENSNYEIIVKDCSLGKGLPVIGVIIIDHENQQYNFKLGSDFIPHIALERCLNEIHQGTVYFKSIPFTFFDVKNNSGYFSDNDYAYINLKKIFVNSSGLWPSSILKNDYSYQYAGLDTSLGRSNDEDLDYSLNLIRSLRYNVYIRDNSKLGFPTYYIIVPGMSELVINKSNCCLYNEILNMTDLLRIGRLKKEEVRSLANNLDKNYELIKKDGFKFSKLLLYVSDKDLLDLEIELLLFMFFYYTEEFDKAKKYMDIFLADKEREEFDYYFAISDFIYLKYLKRYSNENVESILSIGYGKATAEEVILDMEDPQKVFDYHDFPSCFNCEDCKAVTNCKYINTLKIEKKIDNLAESLGYINQNNLKKILVAD